MSIEQWNSTKVDFQCFNCKNDIAHTDEEEESEKDDDEEGDKLNPNILHNNNCGFYDQKKQQRTFSFELPCLY